MGNDNEILDPPADESSYPLTGLVTRCGQGGIRSGG